MSKVVDADGKTANISAWHQNAGRGATKNYSYNFVVPLHADRTPDLDKVSYTTGCGLWGSKQLAKNEAAINRILQTSLTEFGKSPEAQKLKAETTPAPKTTATPIVADTSKEQVIVDDFGRAVAMILPDWIRKRLTPRTMVRQRCMGANGMDRSVIPVTMTGPTTRIILGRSRLHHLNYACSPPS